MNQRIRVAHLWLALFLLPRLGLATPFAYIPNSGSNNVSVIDTATDTIVATVGVGEPTTGVAVNAAGTRVYVANSMHVLVIDTATNSVVATVPVGINSSGITGVAVNPAGTRVYVANSWSQNVSIIDTATNTVVATVVAGDTPLGVAVNPAGTRVYVANLFSNNISVIDTASNTVVATIPVGFNSEPVGLAVDPTGTRVYVANQNAFNVSVIDAATNTVVATANIGLDLPSPRGIAVNPAGTRLYVANGAIIDTATNTVVATVPVSGYGIAVNPAGTRVYLAGGIFSNNVSVIDTATDTVVATVGVGINPIAFGQFIGPAGGTPSNTTVAVEYYYGAWNFYFMTAFSEEIAALDGGAFGGLWQRTGEMFKVWPEASGFSYATCRFFSTAFAPKSSHFYTPFATECAIVKTESAWQYEAIAFYIQLADADGFCSVGTIPLYRLYNNGMGGAPNHRYTTSVTVFNQMAAAGWLFEGNGNTKVFACVPQ